jgi:hypothetical protein
VGEPEGAGLGVLSINRVCSEISGIVLPVKEARLPYRPFTLKNAEFILSVTGGNPPDFYPANVIIYRKPQGPVQESAWTFEAETQMARIVIQAGHLGAHFLDEDTFVPFSNLDWDPKRGFFIRCWKVDDHYELRYSASSRIILSLSSSVI